MQHPVVCRNLLLVHPSWIESRQSFLGCDSICFFSIFILSLQSFLYRDRYFFGFLTLYPAGSVILSIYVATILCVFTRTVKLRHCFCATSSNLCCDLVFMSRQHFCWFLLQQRFLYCQHFYCNQESLSRQSFVSS